MRCLFERPAVQVVAIDHSTAAAAVARGNAETLGLADRVRVVVADLLTPFGTAGADLVVANMPYIPTSLLPTLSPEVARHEPIVALDGGVDGLALVRRLVAMAGSRLASGGALVLETAGGTQTPAVVELMRTAGFTEVATRAALAGVERFVAGRSG